MSGFVPERFLFDSVVKSFGAAPVLNGLSVEIPLQGITFVVGKSGSGKSVLCRLSVGLLKPDSGRVMLGEEPIHQLSERQLQKIRAQVPYIVQSSGLLDWLTLHDNIALANRELKDPTAVDASIERVGLNEFRDRKPTEVSPAVRKRAAIARALVLKPRFLLLDEPTTGMDSAAASQVNDTIASLRESGLGAMVVSHDYRALTALADTVVEVRQGRTGYTGNKAGFLASIQ